MKRDDKKFIDKRSRSSTCCIAILKNCTPHSQLSIREAKLVMSKCFQENPSFLDQASNIYTTTLNLWMRMLDTTTFFEQSGVIRKLQVPNSRWMFMFQGRSSYTIALNVSWLFRIKDAKKSECLRQGERVIHIKVQPTQKTKSSVFFSSLQPAMVFIYTAKRVVNEWKFWQFQASFTFYDYEKSC